MGGSQTRCAQTCAPLIHFPQHITGPARSGSNQNRSLRIALLAQYCRLAMMVDRYRKKHLRTMSADSAMRSEPFINSASASPVVWRNHREPRRGDVVAVAFLCLLIF